MGYRSDVRVITSKKGFKELTNFTRKFLKERNFKYNLLDRLDVKIEGEQEIYFGWNYLKWYDGFEGYEDVTAIVKGLDHINEEGYGYRFSRLGEDYDDYEERYDDGNNEDWLDWISINREFDDGEVM